MFELSSFQIVAALVAGSALKYIIYYLIEIQESKKYKKVGRVSALYIYPVKSCHGIQVEEGECTYLGLSCFGMTDRHWAIAGPDGVYLTQRQEPRMAQIHVTIEAAVMKLDAPGMLSIAVPIDPPSMFENMSAIKVKVDTVPTIDCGDEVSDWLISFLNRPGLRLHFSAPFLQKRCCALAQKTWNHPAQEQDMVALSDYCGYMLLSNPSLAALNQRLAVPVPIDNFRANIIVDQCSAFDEDNWISVRIGSSQLRALDACTRCLLVTVDQEKGIKDLLEEPLATLKMFRLKEPYGLKPAFGVNFTLDRRGIIRVGDPVYAKIGNLCVSAKN